LRHKSSEHGSILATHDSSPQNQLSARKEEKKEIAAKFNSLSPPIKSKFASSEFKLNLKSTETKKNETAIASNIQFKYPIYKEKVLTHKASEKYIKTKQADPPKKRNAP